MDVFYEDFTVARQWKNKAKELSQRLEAVKKLNKRLTEVLVKVAPDHPLAQKENRLKIAYGEKMSL